MKYLFLLSVIFFLFSITPVFSIEEDFVEVYTEAQETHFGRTTNREKTTRVNLNEFLASDSLNCGKNGILTAIIIDNKVKKAFDELLSNKDFHLIDNSIISREKSLGSDVYGFSWDKYGFDVAFSFESISAEIEKEIQIVYSDNGYLYGELEKSYRDNYVIKIYRAEDVMDNNNISFLEAIISATVLGRTFQPLWGIHDGLGVLDNLALSVVKDDIQNNKSLNNYRKVVENDDELFAFIYSTSEMRGDFVENMYSAIKNTTKKTPQDAFIRLPENFFINKVGDPTDYALFFYDILKRKGYSVKFVLIDYGSQKGDLYSTVFFKEKEVDSWGWIDVNGLQRRRAENVERLSALIFSATVDYFEPDVTEIFETRKIVLPPPSIWKKSIY